MTCFNARASWSGHEVPLFAQGMPSSMAMTSSAFLPFASAATPSVLPGQPPANLTPLMMPVCSSMSISMAFEHVPWVGYTVFTLSAIYFMFVYTFCTSSNSSRRSTILSMVSRCSSVTSLRSFGTYVNSAPVISYWFSSRYFCICANCLGSP